MSNTGFRGFADFADSTGSTTAAILAANRVKKSQQQQAPSSSSNNNKSNNLRPSPIYTGSDPRLSLLFRKIGQKRDATTKIRALDELSSVVFAPPTNNNNNDNNIEEEGYTRPEKIASLTHLAFLHETKLGYDNNPSVRSGSYKALVAMKGHVPKAWNGLFLVAEEENDGDKNSGESFGANTTVGMAWCSARGDPSADVVKYSREFVKELLNGEENMSASTAVQPAVLNYCKVVLGCKRANNLQDVINPVSTSFSSTSDNQSSSGKDKKNKGGSKAAVKNAEAAAAVAESEREEMEERHERVMLSVLIGLGALVESQPENASKQYASIEAFPESASITRLMSSSRGPFRRQSYNLVSKFCQFAQSLVQPCESTKYIALATLLPNLLSGEKDSSNFVALFELILSYLSMFRKESDSKSPWELMDAAAFVKSLSKALRKACCGAPATSWGQMILPIVASFPSGDESAVLVVESLWEGRKSAAAIMDTAAIVSSVVECVTYLLLRRPKDSSSTCTPPSSMSKCGQLFLDCLSYFINEAPASGGPASSALDELCMTLARDVVRLDAASIDGGTNDRGITQIKSFFWGSDGSQQTFSSAKRDRQTDVKLTRLMANMIQSNDQNKEQSLIYVLPSAKALFNEIIVHSDSRSNKSCTNEEVELILKIMNICGARPLFPVQKAVETLDGVQQTTVSLEEFCVNNLIRWILIHSKSAPSAISTDFNIGKHLLLSIHSAHQQKQVWETILRELIKSYCDVTTLATGLCAMASDGDMSAIDLIKCQTLDQFAMEMGNSFMKEFWLSHDLSHTDDSNENSSMHQGDMCLFFKACVGLSDCKEMLVSSSVIKHWVEICCDETRADRLISEDEDGENALLETTLLLGSSSDNSVLIQDELMKLILESWRQGGLIWKQTAVTKCDVAIEPNHDISMRDEFVSRASSNLKESIRRKPSKDHAILELSSQSWSKKAARVLDICKDSGLQTVGIDLDLCKNICTPNASESLLLRLMYLLHDVGNPSLLLHGSSNQELLVHVLSAVVDTENALLQTFIQRTQRSRQLVDVLGGPLELNNCVQALTTTCIDLLASYLNDPATNATNCHQTLTALSYLVSLQFSTKWSEKRISEDCILAEDINEGDSLFYEKADGTRVKSRVVKVHTDDFPNLYFTIKEENALEERQTVSNRLKRNPVTLEAPPTEEDKTRREQTARHILDRLVEPFVSKLNFHADISLQNEVSAECINIIISQVGLITIGIGSVRYEIVQTVSSLESCLLKMISGDEDSINQASSPLRCLSLAFGFGLYTKPPPLGENSTDLKLPLEGLFVALIEYYDEHSLSLKGQSPPSLSFHSSVAMWLAVIVKEIKDGDALRRLSGLILTLSETLLFDHDASYSILVMKVVCAFQASAKICIDYSSAANDNEKCLFKSITKCFVDIQDSTGLWMDLYASIMTYYKKEAPEVVLYAASNFSGNLCECLKSPTKRWCAFQMLMVHAKRNKPSGSSDDVILPTATETLLSQWKQNLDEEEASELEDDVHIVALWLPEAMLLFVQELDRAPESSDSQMDYLLGWIIFLEIFDSAGAIDMRNRSSICAFLQKANAVRAMMNLALQEANLDIGRKQNIFECISDESQDFILKELATLALFRTTESLPTLAKTWFNDDCPRYMQQKLMSFVENKVAPETLQRELVRIKDATSFGEMTVNGSAVSREVTAIYHQDECQLSVTIRVPTAFPLRNVEVDLEKTLGIAEKRWRRWSLNIMLMLNNQDGSILDALLLWKENVDKEFEGVEPCPVCYSVLCIKTHSMPNLQCKTCNNRFHSLCLHKWFQSSGKSNCVLCQQPWSGSKVA